MKKEESLEEARDAIEKSIDDVLTLLAEERSVNKLIPLFNVDGYKENFKSEFNSEIAQSTNAFYQRFSKGLSTICESLNHLAGGKEKLDQAVLELQSLLDLLKKEKNNKDFIDEHLQKSPTLASFIGFSSDTLRAFYSAAYDLHQHHKIIESADCFYALCTLDPWVPSFWLSYGNCEQSLTHYLAALHAYAMAALIDSTDPTPHYLTAQCYEKLGDAREAIYSLDLSLNCASETDQSKQIKKLAGELQHKISKYGRSS